MLNNNMNPMMNNMNIGMNPIMNNMNMDINPMMGINNMNQNMGMNPLMNNMNNLNLNNSNSMYMDTTAKNLNSIIEPYENKIRQLEEIIKQKDFEILVLKQKLNNNHNFQNDQMNMNMMIGYLNNINNLNQQINNEIHLIIKSENNEFDIVPCMENDTIVALRTKLTSLNIITNDCSLTHNYIVLGAQTTLKDAGIRNGSIINLQTDIKVIIFSDIDNVTNTIRLDGDCPLNMAIAIYGIISKKYENIKKNYTFLFNSTKLHNNDDTHDTPIKTIFKFSDHVHPVVVVKN